jgi:hypothetical protein
LVEIAAAPESDAPAVHTGEESSEDGSAGRTVTAIVVLVAGDGEIDGALAHDPTTPAQRATAAPPSRKSSAAIAMVARCRRFFISTSQGPQARRRSAGREEPMDGTTGSVYSNQAEPGI